MSAAAPLQVLFDGRPVTALPFHGEWRWRADELSLAMGYKHGRTLVENVRGDWRDDFKEGLDFEILTGAPLAEFKRLFTATVKSGRVDRAPSLMVLRESGLHLALLMAGTETGRRLRRLLADHVLPQLLRTGRVVLPGAPADPEVERLRAENERLRLDALAGVIGEARALASVVEPLRELAMVGAQSRRDIRSNRRFYENKLRNRVSHNGDGSDWPSLPRRKLEKVERLLRHWHKKAVASARRKRLPVGVPTQTLLPFDASLAARRAN